MSFPKAQQVDLSASFSHCRNVLLMRNVKKGSCEYQFQSRWFDPTRNQTRLYSSKGRRSIRLLALAIQRPSTLKVLQQSQSGSSKYQIYY